MPPKIKRQRGIPNQVPVAIIGRLARAKGDEYRGLGRDLLADALFKVVQAYEIIGVRAALVHALDEQSAQFWKDSEFIECPIDSRTFYLPIETILDGLK